MRSYYILFLSFVLLGCSGPKGIEGRWIVEQEECLLKDKKRRFENVIPEQRQYVLHFKPESKVDLIYSNLNVTSRAETESDRNLVCDIIYEGNYTYLPVAATLSFDFGNEQGQLHSIKKGENCDPEFDIELKVLPYGTAFHKDYNVRVGKVGATVLEISFPGFEQCHTGKMRTSYRRITSQRI